MADNFLEKQRERYEQQKSAAERKKQQDFQKKVEAYRIKLAQKAKEKLAEKCEKS